MSIDPADPTAPQPPGWWTQLIDSLESRLLRPWPRLVLWAVLVTGVLVLAGGWVFVASTDEGERRINRPKAPQMVVRVVDVFADGNPVGWVERGIPWVEPALEWLAAYPLIPLVIFFFWLISWGGLARGLGLPDLIWPDGWWQRWWVGVAVSLLFANLLFVRYMLEFRSGIQVDYGQTPSLFWFEPATSEGYKVGQFLLCTLIPCLVVFYVPKMFSQVYWRLASLDRIPGPLFLGLVWGVLVILGLWYLDSAGDVSKQLGRWLRDDVGLRGLNAVPLAWAEMHGRATVMTAIPILALMVFLIESRYGGVWSPVWSVALLIALFSSLYGFIAYHLAGLQLILLLGLLAIAWVCNQSQPYKMSHPGLESYNPLVNPVLLDVAPAGRPHLTPAITARDLLATFHGNWSAKTGTNNTKPKMVVVACSGGGIRAALWTAVVLEGLERALPGGAGQSAFRDHIRLFTGASGGMLAATLYAADFDNPITQPEALSDQLARDALWPTIQTMLFRDIPSVLLPWAVNWDRGRSLEKAWEENTRRYPTPAHRPTILQRTGRIWRGEQPQYDSPLTETFARLRALEAAAQRPSLLFSPMLVEDCRRALISNLDVSALTGAYCQSLDPSVPNAPNPLLQSISAFDFFAYFPHAYDRLAVGTVARMNASFPFVSPGVSLPCDPPRRVVDAGYFDNFGVNLAARWLLEYQDLVKAHTSGVVLIEIRAYPRRIEKVRYEPLDGKGDLLTWGMSEVSTPAEALYNLYSRGAYLRNDQLLQTVGRAFNGAKTDFFTTVCFEVACQAALNWTLPELEAEVVRRGFSSWDAKGNVILHVGVARQVAALRTWFGVGGA